MIVLSLAGGVLATGDTGTAQACGASPRDAVKRYYRGLDDKRFSAAWSCLSTATRKEFGGYDRWKRGYRNTASNVVTSLALVDQAAGLADLSVSIRTCRRSGRAGNTYNVQERFRGRWSAVNGPSGWRLIDPRLRKSASRIVDSCA